MYNHSQCVISAAKLYKSCKIKANKNFGKISHWRNGIKLLGENWSNISDSCGGKFSLSLSSAGNLVSMRWSNFNTKHRRIHCTVKKWRKLLAHVKLTAKHGDSLGFEWTNSYRLQLMDLYRGNKQAYKKKYLIMDL